MPGKTLEDWSAELKKLVARAQAAIAAGDSGEKDAVGAALQRFIDTSPMWASELDDLAEAALAALVASDAAAATAEISRIAAALAKQVKKINEITQANKKTASDLRLERVTAVVDSATGLITQIRQLKMTLEADGAKPATLGELDKAVKAVQEFRSRVEVL